MEVYIEYVVIDNLIINCILLYLTALTLKIRTSKLRIFLSSLVGTVVAVLVPLFTLENGYLLVIKLVLLITMVLILGEFSTVKHFILSCLTLLFFTFLLGGVIIACFYLSGVDYSVYFSLNYDSFMPVGISVFIVVVTAKIIIKAVNYLVKERDLTPFTRRCAIVVNKKKIVTVGFVDSGNRLYGGLTGGPVIVLSKKLFDKVMALGALESVSGLTVETVSGKTDLKLYSIDKLMIYNGERVNIYNNVLIACAENGNFNEGFELLLHPSLC